MTGGYRSVSLAEVLPAQPPSKARGIVSMLPTGVFLAVSHWWGVGPGVITATASSIAIVVARWRMKRRVGILLPASLAYVVVRGIAGILTGSEDVYFGFGIALSALTALAIGATAFTRRPAASHIIPLMVTYRPETITHPLFRRVAAQITIAWMAMELALTSWEAWHLTRVDAAEFVALRTFVGWPAMAIWIFLLVFYLRIRIDPLQFHLAGHVPDIRGNDPYLDD